jgi:hypothetical protein
MRATASEAVLDRRLEDNVQRLARRVFEMDAAMLDAIVRIGAARSSARCAEPRASAQGQR